MYVEELKMTNVRCFESACFRPRYPGIRDGAKLELPNVTLLLGNNGSGKSTTLRGLALGVLSRVLEVSEYQPYSLVRRKSSTKQAEIEATVRLGPLDRAPRYHRKSRPMLLTTRIAREGDYERLGNQTGPYIPDLFVDLSPTFFLVGYGATRRMENKDGSSSRESRSGGLRFARVSSLFYDFVALTPLTAWLPHLKRQQKRRFNEVVGLINKLLPPEVRFLGKQEVRRAGLHINSSAAELAREYTFVMDGSPLSFGALSDGYKAYIVWIADLIYHLCQCTPDAKKLTDLTGLVLVDEVDLHLHPSWQREVMRTISRALPRLQFVCTTHSPIVAGTLRRQQVFVMDRGPRGAVTIRQIEERIHGLNADQILTSPYFGLATTRAPDFMDELRGLRQKAWKGDPIATIEFLEKMIPAATTANAATSGSGTRKNEVRARAASRRSAVA